MTTTLYKSISHFSLISNTIVGENQTQDFKCMNKFFNQFELKFISVTCASSTYPIEIH